MDLRFTPEENAFRAEVRAFMKDNLPATIRNKMIEGRRLGKDDLVTWQRILNAKGWAVPHWPKEWGGTGWSPVEIYLYRDEMQQAPAPEPLPFGINMLGPVLIAFGNDGAEEALSAAHRQSRRLVVPGLLRARRRLRPRQLANAGQARRRPLCRQRPEDLDHAGAICRLDLLSGAHRSGGEEAGRHFVPADRHALARHHRAPDPDHRRRSRSQRGVLRRRESAGGESGRRGEQGLELRQIPARQRAHAASPASAFPSRASAGSRSLPRSSRPAASR